MTYLVLGSNGFIGRKLVQRLQLLGLEVAGLDSTKLNFLDPATFINTPENKELTIIDCIARLDGSFQEVEAVNVSGLRHYLSYLNRHKLKFTYVYLSSVSTIMPEIIFSNDYILTKFFAEKLIMSMCEKYKIVRLIFPFGAEEKPARLIRRIVKKLQHNEPLTIEDLHVNLTPVNFLVENFDKILGSEKSIINFSTGHVYSLIEIVEYLQSKINSGSQITYLSGHKEIVVSSDLAINCDYHTVFKELDLYLS